MKIFPLAAYTFSHFSVDFLCFWILFGHFSAKTPAEEIAGGFILYNFLAFGLQMLIGFFCDGHRKFPGASLGCFLVFAAVLISPFLPLLSLVVTAVGNAFFHVGGGIESLVHSGGRLYRGGVFVSSGALGVVAGTLAGMNSGRGESFFPEMIFPAVLALFCCAICFFAQKKYPNEGESSVSGAANDKAGIIAVLAFALVSVIIRSFGGGAIPMEWKTTAELGLLSGGAAFLGKFLGGFAADSFGARRTGIITLLASLPLMIFGSGNILLSVFGILLFNMTMPITLGICAEKLPQNPGLAFGLTTAALLLGALPGFFFVFGERDLLLVSAVIISAFCIYFSAKNKRTEKEVFFDVSA